MSYLIAGLGNPGAEYVGTRHNTGFRIVEALRRAKALPSWRSDKKGQALTARGRIGKVPVELILPQTSMNRSGEALKGSVKTEKEAERLLLVHDDLDLPLGCFKLSFNRGSAGHRGVESVIKALRTKAFVRLRIGISPATAGGKLKKPPTEKKIVDFILGRWSKKEEAILKKLTKKTAAVIEAVLEFGLAKAMSLYN